MLPAPRLLGDARPEVTDRPAAGSCRKGTGSLAHEQRKGTGSLAHEQRKGTGSLADEQEKGTGSLARHI
jgi:hypothetical protein